MQCRVPFRLTQFQNAIGLVDASGCLVSAVLKSLHAWRRKTDLKIGEPMRKVLVVLVFISTTTALAQSADDDWRNLFNFQTFSVMSEHCQTTLDVDLLYRRMDEVMFRLGIDPSVGHPDLKAHHDHISKDFQNEALDEATCRNALYVLENNYNDDLQEVR